MVRRLIPALVVVVAVATFPPVRAQRPDQAAVMLEAARQKETLDGDLQNAIKQYQAIVSTYAKTNRAVAAQALLRMAEAYQKLGDAQAQKVYERIVREYADQKEAVVLARTRLESSRRPANTPLHREVWTPPGTVDIHGKISPDGRYLPFRDLMSGLDGGFFLKDMTTGAVRRLIAASPAGTVEESQYAEGSPSHAMGAKLPSHGESVPGTSISCA